MDAPEPDSSPFISGFTVIRNARQMGYPVVQAIRSILPIVDEYVVGVGQSDDDTREIIESIDDPRIRIFDSYWDPSKQKSGLVLSEKTNEALDQCRGEWCFYLQADEVVHEAGLPAIVEGCRRYRDDPRVEAPCLMIMARVPVLSVPSAARHDGDTTRCCPASGDQASALSSPES